ncbi:class I SAM-dependent rRNA methyltransferase [Ruminococcus sp.]|uniref:class I SAM-dependent rRNA methyltransferase n=1 Tax=Ruminococcus sp. TaxID=41978 RepID=UPI0025FDA988|nr:class I SAM-dependent rRNA methyltransferase [Ruminococcus sp.]MBQ8967702.1 class I SAM-dependent rRNA methyltransferase [Ruminococcus sp.]
MKQQRSFPAFIVTKRCGERLKNGHPWVYDNEIVKSPEDVENGVIADVLTEKGGYLGSGLVSLNSKIRVRILSDNANEKFGEEFFRRRIRYALDHRKTVMGDDISACRLVHGESDGLCGLTVDRYGDILSVQVLSFGMEQRKDMLYRLLTEELAKDGVSLRGIMERNDVAIRELEGLEKGKGWYKADFLPAELPDPVTEICENGIVYKVDVENGQKTGFFLDQKYNRLAVAKLSKGKKVLDCFTHTGSFAMNAAMGGAEHVTAVDVSQFAVDTARANAERNNLSDKMDFICADVFDLLPKLAEEKAGYDFIILDPPAFTKSRKTVNSAERGYKEINYRAMKLLPRGGYLATCSCSHFMRSDLFVKMLMSAAKDAGVRLKLVEERKQGPDHPILMNVPETDYLKFFLFQVI